MGETLTACARHWRLKKWIRLQEPPQYWVSQESWRPKSYSLPGTVPQLREGRAGQECTHSFLQEASLKAYCVLSGTRVGGYTALPSNSFHTTQWGERAQRPSLCPRICSLMMVISHCNSIPAWPFVKEQIDVQSRKSKAWLLSSQSSFFSLLFFFKI